VEGEHPADPGNPAYLVGPVAHRHGGEHQVEHLVGEAQAFGAGVEVVNPALGGGRDEGSLFAADRSWLRAAIGADGRVPRRWPLVYGHRRVQVVQLFARGERGGLELKMRLDLLSVC
jgi:hypothetical protein